jgi:hypothetical protein
MALVAGFDVHRNQITFDALDTETGELARGRIHSTREAVYGWVGRFPGQQLDVAVEACTGWLFVREALDAAGAVPHLADPAEVSARRGRKRRAKTDRADARHLRERLAAGRLPEAWIPPAHVREWRTRARLRKPLSDERGEWLQRIQATLFHHGVPVGAAPPRLLGSAGRDFLDRHALPDAALPSTITSPALRPWIQLSPRVREAIRPTPVLTLRNHSPPPFTGGPCFR